VVQLTRLDGYRDHIRRTRHGVSQKQKELAERIEHQRVRLVEARRSHELLKEMKGRALEHWKKEFDRELEEQTAESVASKWQRNRRPRVAVTPSGRTA